jgi:hypothetical protein
MTFTTLNQNKTLRESICHSSRCITSNKTHVYFNLKDQVVQDLIVVALFLKEVSQKVMDNSAHKLIKFQK